MTKTPAIQCNCGTVKGAISDRALTRHNHLVCYCRDCQAFARFVANEDTMDDKGGTEIVQVSCADVTITEGQESLAAIRLAEGGLVRWYASCCNTPIGNAPGVGLPFIGLIHDCLTPNAAVKPAFGPVSLVAFAGSARTDDKPITVGMPMGMLRFLLLALGAKFRGDGKKHPFFKPSGEPLVTPQVLQGEARAVLYAD